MGRTVIRFDVEWKDAPGVRDPVLARTWCALTIRVDNEVVTRVSDKRTKGWRNAVYGSVFPMCSWIVDNVWFLLHEPYRWASPYGSRDLARNAADRPWVHRHSLLAAREGGALPDLTLCRDGDAVLARWLRDGGDASHPFLRFVQEGHARLDPEAVRRSLGSLVETVLMRVSDMAEPEVAELRDNWLDVERLGADERDLCIRAAQLGINAHYDDELCEDDARRLTSVIRRLGSRLTDDLLEVAAMERIAQDAEWIDEAHRMAGKVRRNRKSEFIPMPRVATPGTTGDRSAAAYATGYDHARDVRRCVGLADNVLTDLRAFVARFGWADVPVVTTPNAPASPLRAVVDYGKEDVPFIASHAPGSYMNERFVLARSLFLQSSSPSPERRLVTSTHTWSQRASRAFAAELLAPAAALRSRIGNDQVSRRDVADLADEFGVDRELIERQLENNAIASVDRVRDGLRQW